MTTYKVTKIHFQLKPGDLLTYVGESTTRMFGEAEMHFTDSKGDPWSVPVSKVELYEN